MELKLMQYYSLIVCIVLILGSCKKATEEEKNIGYTQIMLGDIRPGELKKLV